MEYKDVKPKKSMCYRPAAKDWRNIVTMTEFMANDDFDYHNMELINFDTYMIHLKSGKRIPFDCLSEAQYIHVVNGGYYEEAPEIIESERRPITPKTSDYEK